MLINKSIFFFLVALCISFSTYSQEQALYSIVQADLQRYLIFISSDSLRGRHFGTDVPGLQIAADYIRKNIQKDGLKPGCDNYFQTVPIISAKPDAENTFLKITSENGKTIYDTPDILSLNRQAISEVISGEGIFAGFGWQDTLTGYDDLKGIDLKGKIAFIVQGTPEMLNKTKAQRWNNRMELTKTENIFNAGAKAVIVVTSPNDVKSQTFNQVKSWRARQQYSLVLTGNNSVGNPVFIVAPDAVDAMLGKHGRLKKLLKSGDKNQICFNRNYKIDVQVNRIAEPLKGTNVIGVVEGSDPVLKNECVVYMAHYDHLGIGKDGDVYNGADDNGSGTVALLELAKAFQSLKVKPKRSILFLWVTGEEIGLFGSEYYVNHPVFPIEKTDACINIDMIGRVYEPRDSVWKNSPKQVKDYDGVYTLASNFCPQMLEISDSACKSLNLVPDKSLPERFIRSSDQYNFHKKGVPILNVATGYHADYHKVTDEVSRINFDKMKRVVDLCFLVGYKIADQQYRLEVVSAEK